MDPALLDIKDGLNQVVVMIHNAIHNARNEGKNTPKTDEILGILGYLVGVVDELYEVVKHHDRLIKEDRS